MVSFMLLLLLPAVSCALPSLPHDELLISSGNDAQALLAFINDTIVSPSHPLRWNSSGYGSCSWTGVSCSASTSRVIALSLPSMNLSGPLSPRLADLPFLSFLNLSDNQFTGPIPASLSRLLFLTHLDLSNNPFSGPIPASFASLLNLRMLQLHHIPNLSGQFPVQLIKLANLTHLCLGFNNLTGTIPPEIGTMKNLIELAAYKSNFTGFIPRELGQLRSVQTLKLFSNPFAAGGLPPELGNMISLQYLYLSDCNLLGSIPAQLGGLVNLLVLGLSQNHLSGPIPATLGQLKNLAKLDLYNNNVSGSIPPQLGQLGNLQGLFLGSNNLSGSIPPEIGKLRNLLVLDLNQNHLSGPILATLGQLKNLTEFNIYNNNVSGSIPPQIGQLVNLQSLYLSSNNLSGRIPPEIGKLRNLQAVDIYSNTLQGPLPAGIGELTSLQFFRAWANNLQGNLPPEMGQLKNLIQLSLNGNSFWGCIPEEFGMLESLQFLDMGSSNLTGQIPPTFGNLGNLTYLKLSDNELSGILPPALANCSELRWLWLDNNYLSGEIPLEYATFPQLETLSLRNNDLRGRLPGKCGNLSILTALQLDYNYFNGPLPDAWSQIENVIILTVGHNQLEGSFPYWIWNLKQLQVLDLSHNLFRGNISNHLSRLTGFQESQHSDGSTPLQYVSVEVPTKGQLLSYTVTTSLTTSLDLSGNQFQGEIPKEIGELSGLVNLNLSRNRLTGAIPGSLGDIKDLESLDLCCNNLSGNIPNGLLQLTFLSDFNVSYNNLSGPIPDSTQFSTFLNDSYLGNPLLCGTPLTLSCSSNQTAPPTEGSGHQTPTPYVIKYAIAATAAGFIVVILGVALLWGRSFACSGERLREIAQKSPVHLFDERLRVVERELFHAVQECNDCNLIGMGGTSDVYKCVLSTGKVVAVKKARSWSHELAIKRHFLRECKILGKIRHRNVLKMLGICATPDILACILDFVGNGSMDDHLHEARACPMSWEHRFKVAISVAEGLGYLHNDTGFGQILHLDLKPSNILLDDDFEPRISDFGISRLIERDQKWASVTSNFRGSIGYVAPECSYTQKLSDKADVYSFGVILLEILTGKRPTSDTFGTQSDLRAWVANSFSDNTWTTVLDETLKVYIETAGKFQEVYAVGQVGLLCTMPRPNNRPNMKEVLKMLVEIRQGKTARDEVHNLNMYLAGSCSTSSVNSISMPSSSNFTPLSSPFNLIEQFSRGNEKMDEQCIHSSPPSAFRGSEEP